MKTLGNLLWLLLTGIVSGLAWILLGIVWCITLVGIPFGKQCFKIANLSFMPFGRTGETHFDRHPIANIIWIIFGGLGIALGFLFAGIIWCITIIGIPFGKQCFKLAALSLSPFGAEVKEIVK